MQGKNVKHIESSNGMILFNATYQLENLLLYHKLKQFLKNVHEKLCKHKNQVTCYIYNSLRDRQYQIKISLGSFRMSCLEIWKKLCAELQ